MADLKVRIPWANVTDPTAHALLTMVDNGDGTHSPKISGGNATANGGAPANATYLTKTASSGLSAEIAIGTGTSGQVLTSDGTNPGWANPAGGSTPTLAAVLAAGNETGGTSLIGAPYDPEGLGYPIGGAVGANAGSIVNGGSAFMLGGYSVNGNGAQLSVGGAFDSGDDADGGDITLTPGTGAGAGHTGRVNFPIYSQAAGAPGATLTTLLYGDTTAVSGGLYVWNGSAYRKVSGVLP